MLYPLSYGRMPPGWPSDWTRIADVRRDAEISGASSTPAPLTPMIGRMRSPRGTAVAAVACLLLAGCSSGDDQGAREPAGTPTSLPVVPAQPRVQGPVDVTLQSGLTVMTGDECRPGDAHRVCSVDGRSSWAPVQKGTPATLTLAGTHLADQHTSWTTVLRFDERSRSALRRTADEAAGVGGLVLVMVGGRVLAAVPPGSVHGPALVVTDLDKPAAWALVSSFEGR